ncbi:hypothetical protein FGO68_gene8568 [Halteria grandinella]|uniref:Uncharacterized protein n=1 Tax=Halteria grandinella TaxID=5974 RepID=A0A8J8T651_HALGN|nr:hypothetical protein FGO68_gene8568 [Halteria grandinella]
MATIKIEKDIQDEELKRKFKERRAYFENSGHPFIQPYHTTFNITDENPIERHCVVVPSQDQQSFEAVTKGPIDKQQGLRWYTQIVIATTDMEMMGIPHGNILPQNIVICSQQYDSFIRLRDLEIQNIQDDEINSKGKQLAGIFYMLQIIKTKNPIKGIEQIPRWVDGPISDLQKKLDTRDVETIHWIYRILQSKGDFERIFTFDPYFKLNSEIIDLVFDKKLRPSNLFLPGILDSFVAMLDVSLNKQKLTLNADKHSKIAEMILKDGWKWPLEILNASVDSARIVEWKNYQGLNGLTAYSDGLFYGQMLEGKMDGLGMLYTQDLHNNPVLYECIWKKSQPQSGRLSINIQNHMHIYEGYFDWEFYPNGVGTQSIDSHGSHTGMFKRGKKNGKGVYTFANGDTAEGTWIKDYQEGSGKFTQKETQEYQIGNYVKNSKFGIHTCYSIIGVYKNSKFYHEGKLFKTIILQQDEGDTGDLQIKNMFQHEVREQLLELTNLMTNERRPKLDQSRQSNLFAKLLSDGWLWDISFLNSKASTDRIVEWNYFEGINRQPQISDLEPGVYYGQMLNGKRDGYGMLFCTASGPQYFEDDWSIYECKWKDGIPTEGRKTVNNSSKYSPPHKIGKWSTFEGTMSPLFELTGQGLWTHQDFGSYTGTFVDGLRSGYGTYHYPNILDGALELDWRGERVRPFTEGQYEEGEWLKGKQIGVHKQYLESGVLYLHRYFEKGKEVKRVEIL